MVETINIQLSLTLSPFLSPIQVFIQRYWVDYNTWRYSFIVLSTLDFPIPFSHSDSSRVRWRREGQFQGHVTKCMGSILPGTFSWWRGMRGAFTYKLYWFCVCVWGCVCVCVDGGLSYMRNPHMSEWHPGFCPHRPIFNDRNGIKKKRCRERWACTRGLGSWNRQRFGEGSMRPSGK